MKKHLFHIIISLFIFKTQAQSEVQWLSIQEAETRNKTNPKPILVDVYTDWCGWCKRMDATTYADQQVIDFLNTNFYPVKFNAETRDTIIFQGQTYANKGAGGRSTHELAQTLLSGKLSYPTTYFMDETMKTNLIVPGYLDAQGIAPFLVFYKEQIYNAASINEYRDLFEKAFKPQTTTAPQVNWLTMQEALKKNETEKKKLLVFLNDAYSISGKVMEATNFTDSTIVNYINKNYLAVKFDTRSQETITIKGQQLINDPTDGEYHQLVLAGMRGNELKFPAILFFDQDNLLITPVPQYMTPGFMMPVISYFKEDKYKDTDFAEYLKNYPLTKTTN